MRYRLPVVSSVIAPSISDSNNTQWRADGTRGADVARGLWALVCFARLRRLGLLRWPAALDSVALATTARNHRRVYGRWSASSDFVGLATTAVAARTATETRAANCTPAEWPA